MGKYTKESAPGWVQDAISLLAKTLETDRDSLFAIAVSPPKPELGDLAVPMFQFAKVRWSIRAT